MADANGSHPSKQRTAMEMRPLRIALLSPGTTATHDVYKAFCMLGLPATHWDDTICSTHTPMLNTDTQCVFNTSDRMAGQQLGYYPYPARMTHLLLAAARCGRQGKRTDGWRPIQLPGIHRQQHDTRQECRIDKWRSDFDQARTLFHMANTSVADDPFHSLSLYEHLPSAHRWLFVYNHRNPIQWARSRIRGHAEWVPVCDVRVSALAKMVQQDVSPLDVEACLQFCVEHGVAAASGRLSSCLTTVLDLGVERMAHIFEQHTRIALWKAPAPVLELHLFSGRRRLLPADIARRLQRFVERHSYTTPCKLAPAAARQHVGGVEEDGGALL
jgi:hypothetical protein